MTFKMYAVDFCELLLFDEHKQVYNMVLHAFDKRCGLEAYIRQGRLSSNIYTHLVCHVYVQGQV